MPSVVYLNTGKFLDLKKLNNLFIYPQFSVKYNMSVFIRLILQ